MTRTTILLADDHTVVRQGFRQLLEHEPDLDVVGEAGDGRRAVAMVMRLHPAVVLMDIAMPLLNGLEATRQIVKEVPDTKVIILSAHSDEAYRHNANASGAVGFLLKQSSAHELAQTIRDIMAGTATTKMNSFLRDHTQPEETPDQQRIRRPAAPLLTSRETEVLQLVAEGQGNKQIAGILGISIKTVEKHRTHLMDKLNRHNTAELTGYAISIGIVESHVPLLIV